MAFSSDAPELIRLILLIIIYEHPQRFSAQTKARSLKSSDRLWATIYEIEFNLDSLNSLSELRSFDCHFWLNCGMILKSLFWLKWLFGIRSLDAQRPLSQAAQTYWHTLSTGGDLQNECLQVPESPWNASLVFIKIFNLNVLKLKSQKLLRANFQTAGDWFWSDD